MFSPRIDVERIIKKLFSIIVILFIIIIIIIIIIIMLIIIIFNYYYFIYYYYYYYCYYHHHHYSNLTLLPPYVCNNNNVYLLPRLIDVLRDFGQEDWDLSSTVCKVLCNYSTKITSSNACFGDQEAQDLSEILLEFLGICLFFLQIIAFRGICLFFLQIIALVIHVCMCVYMCTCVRESA